MIPVAVDERLGSGVMVGDTHRQKTLRKISQAPGMPGVIFSNSVIGMSQNPNNSVN